MTENKIINNRTENKASRMLHTSLLTFLPSPLLITLPPPFPLQFWCCLYSPAPRCIDICPPWQPLPAPPQIQTPLFLHPSSIMHQEFILQALHFGLMGSDSLSTSPAFQGLRATLTSLPEVISSTYLTDPTPRTQVANYVLIPLLMQ